MMSYVIVWHIMVITYMLWSYFYLTWICLCWIYIHILMSSSAVAFVLNWSCMTRWQGTKNNTQCLVRGGWSQLVFRSEVVESIEEDGFKLMFLGDKLRFLTRRGWKIWDTIHQTYGAAVIVGPWCWGFHRFSWLNNFHFDGPTSISSTNQILSLQRLDTSFSTTSQRSQGTRAVTSWSRRRYQTAGCHSRADLVQLRRGRKPPPSTKLLELLQLLLHPKLQNRKFTNL